MVAGARGGFAVARGAPREHVPGGCAAGAALLAACAMALAACASGPPRTLDLRLGEQTDRPPPVFPTSPAAARYRYLGELLGEQNFRGGDGAGSALGRLLRAIAGLVVGEGRPVVLQRPQAGAVDGNGRIYITDASRQAVYVFDVAAGELAVWDRAEGLTRFAAPVGIDIGPQGEILVADAELGMVARLDRRGEPLGALGRGKLKRPTGLAYDASGQRIYVADTYAHDVKVFDAGGNLLRTIGRRGAADGEFNFPTYLALAQGELYVTDTLNNRIQVFDTASGEWKRTFGARGLYVGNLVRPKGVAVDREGNVYVVESYYDHLLVFDRDGEFLMGIGGSGQGIGQFYLPSGVWVDSRDRVYVADMFNGRVVVFQALTGPGGGNGR